MEVGLCWLELAPSHWLRGFCKADSEVLSTEWPPSSALLSRFDVERTDYSTQGYIYIYVYTYTYVYHLIYHVCTTPGRQWVVGIVH